MTYQLAMFVGWTVAGANLGVGLVLVTQHNAIGALGWFLAGANLMGLLYRPRRRR